MKVSSATVSACRHCQFYAPEGRRGGHCRKLNVAVQSRWEACSFATPPFATTWKELESIALWKQKILLQEGVVLSVEGTLSGEMFDHSQTLTIPTTSRAISS